MSKNEYDWNIEVQSGLKINQTKPTFNFELEQKWWISSMELVLLLVILAFGIGVATMNIDIQVRNDTISISE